MKKVKAMIELDYEKNNETLKKNEPYFFIVVKEYISGHTTTSVDLIKENFDVLYEFDFYLKNIFNKKSDAFSKGETFDCDRYNLLIKNVSRLKKKLVKREIENKRHPLPTVNRYEKQNDNDDFFNLWISEVKKDPIKVDTKTLNKIKEVTSLNQEIKIDMKESIGERGLLSGFVFFIKKILN